MGLRWSACCSASDERVACQKRQGPANSQALAGRSAQKEKGLAVPSRQARLAPRRDQPCREAQYEEADQTRLGYDEEAADLPTRVDGGVDVQIRVPGEHAADQEGRGSSHIRVQ